ncbi:MAG: hypothetical protein K2X38_15515 [Gemmataceae bacterium]|nr:hypothetical protein [Gemmataceae bacterium]
MHGVRLRLAIPLLFAALGMSNGCSPASLTFLLMPFVNDNIPAVCPLAKKDKELSVALVCRAHGLETRPELLPAEQEIADLLSKHLKKRFAENKEKVTVVPPSRVRPYMAKAGSDASSLHELGKTLKADYVVSLEITQFSLNDNSLRTLYRGAAEIDIKVLDVSKDEGEATVWTQVYKREYPRGRHVDAGEMSQLQFRANFGNAIAGDLARFFTEYPKDERNSID